MIKCMLLFSLLSSIGYPSQNSENSPLKGVRIVDDISKVKKEGFEQIEGIQFDGIEENRGLEKELSSMFQDFPLTANNADELCSMITNHYIDSEDVRMGVSLPEQNIANGVVQMVLAPEKLGKVEVRKNQFTNPDSLKRWVRLSSAEPINQKTVAQDVAWMNTSPYRVVKAEYRTSGEPGVTNVDLIVSDKKNWKVSTGIENTGTMPIGKNRLFTRFEMNNFIFDDHTLKLDVTAADHLKEYQSYKAEYVAPLPWRNTLSINGEYSATSPNRTAYPQKHRKAFKGKMSYAIPQWLGKNFWVDSITYEAGFEIKGTNTNLFDENNPTPVKKELALLSKMMANVKAVRNRSDTKLKASIDLIGSPAKMLSNQSNADFNNLREGARPQYFYSKLSLSLERKLSNWNLFMQGKSQFAFSNLIPAEQFSLGGYSTVRGYDEFAVGGDNSFCTNIELRAPELKIGNIWLPSFHDKLILIGFIDGGYVWYRNEVKNKPLHQGLIGVGPGLRYSVDSYFSSRLDLGFPLLKVESSKRTPHLHFNAMMSY